MIGRRRFIAALAGAAACPRPGRAQQSRSSVGFLNAGRSDQAVLALKALTGSDPIELGLVAILSRPGGNVTGVTFLART